jgi:hypothetical protein
MDDFVCEVLVYPPMANTVSTERSLASDEVLVLKVSTNTVRQKIVKRDDDLLTPEQVRQHWPEVRAAMLNELLTGAKAEVLQPDTMCQS